MSAALHGLFSHPEGTTELRFGFTRLLEVVWASQVPLPARETAPWPFRAIDSTYVHLHMVARHLPQKLEHAATLFAQRSTEFGAAVLNDQLDASSDELAILLDAIIVYVRIIPDVLAAVTPYFYEHLSPASASFRDHIKWFTRTRAGADPDYESILAMHTGWFHDLAGKEEKGIRDLLIHRFGRFQFPVTVGPPELRGQVSADLFTTGGYHYDATVMLPQIMQGLCAFLDAYVAHFSARIAAFAGWTPFEANGRGSCNIMGFPVLPPSHWLFPVLRGAA